MTIFELAQAAIDHPEGLSPAGITRLGTWIVDHVDHIRAHREMMEQLGIKETGQPALAPPVARTGLAKRLEAAPTSDPTAGAPSTQQPGTIMPLPEEPQHDEPQEQHT